MPSREVSMFARKLPDPSGRRGTRLGAFLASFALLSALAVGVTRQNPQFTSSQKAYYLDPKQIAFVRPGLVVRILSASIDNEGRIQARFRVTDPRGLPLDRLGLG